MGRRHIVQAAARRMTGVPTTVARLVSLRKTEQINVTTPLVVKLMGGRVAISDSMPMEFQRPC
jgi:hypothetical protein